jgi:hypothetical protein
VLCFLSVVGSVVSGENESPKLTFEVSTLVTATDGASVADFFGGNAAERSSDESKSSSKLLLSFFDSLMDGSAEPPHASASKLKLFCDESKGGCFLK